LQRVVAQQAVDGKNQVPDYAELPAGGKFQQQQALAPVSTWAAVSAQPFDGASTSRQKLSPR
jgi:hypothetical protein